MRGIKTVVTILKILFLALFVSLVQEYFCATLKYKSSSKIYFSPGT